MITTKSKRLFTLAAMFLAKFLGTVIENANRWNRLFFIFLGKKEYYSIRSVRISTKVVINCIFSFYVIKKRSDHVIR